MRVLPEERQGRLPLDVRIDIYKRYAARRQAVGKSLGVLRSRRSQHNPVGHARRHPARSLPEGVVIVRIVIEERHREVEVRVGLPGIVDAQLHLAPILVGPMLGQQATEKVLPVGSQNTGIHVRMVVQPLQDLLHPPTALGRHAAPSVQHPVHGPHRHVSHPRYVLYTYFTRHVYKSTYYS